MQEFVGLQLAVFAVMALGLLWLAAVFRQARVTVRRFRCTAGALSRDPDEGVLVLDPGGRVESVNETAQVMLGWTRAELMGAALHQRMHPHPQFDCGGVATECALHALTWPETQVHRRHLSLKRQDGSVLDVSATASIISDRGKHLGAVLTFRDVTEQMRQIDALQDREERYRSLVEGSPDAMLLSDLYGYVVTANKRAAEMYRYASTDHMLGIRVVELFAPDDRKRVLDDTRKALERGSIRHIEYHACAKNGTSFPAEISTTAVLDEQGQPRAVVYVGRDVTERRMSEQAARWSESRAGLQHAASAVLAISSTAGEAIYDLLQTVCEIAEWEVGVFWTVDSRESVLRCSAVWHAPSVEMMGFGEVTQQLSIRRGDDLPGRVWEQSAPIWVSDVVSDAHFPRALMASREGLHAALCVPVRVRGSVHGVMEFFGRDPRHPNESLTEAVTAVAAQFGQFMERKHAEKALEYQALHDPLTDLPNRTLLLDRLQRALHAARGTDKTLALLLMDLDGFKDVNDTYGHYCGDQLLKQVAARLQRVVRESDTVARLGGDEFALVLPATDEGSAIHVAGKVLETLERAYVVEGTSLTVGASVGIALYPAHGEEGTILMQHADVAMYLAKRAGTGYAVYASEERAVSLTSSLDG